MRFGSWRRRIRRPRHTTAEEPAVLSSSEWHRLVEAGVIDKPELIAGRAMMGEHPLAFSDSQVAAAARLGITIPSRRLTRRVDPDELPREAEAIASNPVERAEAEAVRKDLGG